MKICLAGDVFLGGDLMIASPAQMVTVRAFNDADVRIVNIEQAVSDYGIPENKGTLFTSAKGLESAVRMRINSAGIANNHIHDKGLDAVVETCGHLDDAGIRNFGAGANLGEARKPVLVEPGLVILGYCDFDRPYLRQVAVAGENRAGVNPLRYENIASDLEPLPANVRAILYFHWGREHVWLPPRRNIELAELLLDDPRVALIVGMHPHRPQGYIQRHGKRAYFCVGNFLFPNFFMSPPSQLLDLEEMPKSYDVTRQYHSVYRTTYKKWRLKNRVSIVVTYDSDSGETSHDLCMQLDDTPEVVELSGFRRLLFDRWVRALSVIYTLPGPVYTLLEVSVNWIERVAWSTQIRVFKVRQVFAVSGVRGLWRMLVLKWKRRHG